jgi:uncharacterized protein (TIGR00730 family)
MAMNRSDDSLFPQYPNGHPHSAERNGAGGGRGAHPRTVAVAPRERSRPLIAVFGSAAVKRGDPLFTSGIRLGEMLGRSGFDVMTGGYQGVMEAVSRGAREAGAHVIGVTMRRFEDRVNRYVMDEIRTLNFYERFGWLVDRADGYIAMEGGIGTLAEVTFTWQEILLGMVRTRPLVLVGARWRRLFTAFRANLIADSNIYESLRIVVRPESAVELMRAHFGFDDARSMAHHH